MPAEAQRIPVPLLFAVAPFTSSQFVGIPSPFGLILGGTFVAVLLNTKFAPAPVSPGPPGADTKEASDQSPVSISSSVALAFPRATALILKMCWSPVAGITCVQPSNEVCPSAKGVVDPDDSTKCPRSKFQYKLVSGSAGAEVSESR